MVRSQVPETCLGAGCPFIVKSHVLGGRGREGRDGSGVGPFIVGGR